MKIIAKDDELILVPVNKFEKQVLKRLAKGHIIDKRTNYDDDSLTIRISDEEDWGR